MASCPKKGLALLVCLLGLVGLGKTAEGAVLSCKDATAHFVTHVLDGGKVVFQLASNKDRISSGHFSLAQGLLRPYQSQDLAGLGINLHPLPAIWSGKVPMYVMKAVVDTANSSAYDFGAFYPTDRQDRIVLHITVDGWVTVVLLSWSNAALLLQNTMCWYAGGNNYLMSGYVSEDGHHRLISINFRFLR